MEQSTTLTDTDNLIIKGNNFIALKSLLKRYTKKINCIYIDPPYNTGTDSFQYNDKFNHASWLAFMKNRLEIAKDLLREDGVIFVQCDNSPSTLYESPELGYLQVLLDEIFGRKNYLTILTWKKKGNPSNTTNGIGTITESIFLYAKNRETVTINLLPFKRGYKFEKNGRKYNLESPIKSNEGQYERKTMIFPIITEEGTFWPPDGQRWTFGKEEMDQIVATKQYEIIDEEFKIKKYEDDYKLGDQKLYNNLLLKQGELKSAKKELEALGFPKEHFATPKPETLLKYILEMATKKEDLILDFCLGSGTTAAVAHKMGRRYIGIEQMDYIESITVERLKKVIAGEQGGISKSVGWKGGGSFVYCELLEDGAGLIRKIQDVTEDSIDAMKEKIYSDDRIVPYIMTKELEQTDKEFENLSLEDKKKALITLVDKNKLYVNYADMDDESYRVSDVDKKFTKSFYEVK